MICRLSLAVSIFKGRDFHFRIRNDFLYSLIYISLLMEHIRIIDGKCYNDIICIYIRNSSGSMCLLFWFLSHDFFIYISVSGFQIFPNWLWSKNHYFFPTSLNSDSRRKELSKPFNFFIFKIATTTLSISSNMFWKPKMFDEILKC